MCFYFCFCKNLCNLSLNKKIKVEKAGVRLSTSQFVHNFGLQNESAFTGLQTGHKERTCNHGNRQISLISGHRFLISVKSEQHGSFLLTNPFLGNCSSSLAAQVFDLVQGGVCKCIVFCYTVLWTILLPEPSD